MQVLFLALGASRRRAVVEEAASVVEAEGRAVVLVDDAQRWRKFPFAPGVETVDVSGLGWAGRALRVERLVLFRGPRAVAGRVGRWRLRAPVRRLLKAYERRLVTPIHRRLFLPVHRRWWDRARPGLIERRVLSGAKVGTLVVSDAISMPDAVRILGRYTARGEPAPAVVFSVDQAGLRPSPVG